MNVPTLDASAVIEPIRALGTARGTLAVITRIDGPSYRPLGAMMAVLEDGQRIGTLSSGCIEADIAVHAAKALESGTPFSVVYGKGSPFADITLPCGGGLEIMLLPAPDAAALAELLAHHDARQVAALEADARTGRIVTVPEGQTGWTGDVFTVRIEPEIFFYVFGKGPEAATFAGMVCAAGFPCLVLSPDSETLEAAAQAGADTRHMTAADWPRDLKPDSRSAVVLFFHDHEWEPPILSGALTSDAFYIGAQGSMRAAELRRHELTLAGVGPEALARLRGPIGLVPSVRDARKLAVSVLAEVLSLG